MITFLKKCLPTLILILSFACIDAEEPCRKTVWFLGGHMQHLFAEEYLKPMRQAGYDLTPWHELKKMAFDEGFDFVMADPNASFLTPFSHERSGIAQAATKNPPPAEPILKQVDLIIVFEVVPHQMSYLKQYPKEKLILFLWEPPSVMPQNYDPAMHEPFGSVYTWNDELVDNEKYFKFYHPVLHEMIESTVPFESKKLSVMIAGNRTSPYPGELYTARRNVVAFFEKHHPLDFDLWGKWWPLSYKTYKGAIDDKTAALSRYKFNFSYENVKNIPGYITEKIFDSFAAGCVPIYLGAPNISASIPKNCYIDPNDYQDEHALYTSIRDMPKEEHAQYIANIKTFLSSPQAQVFSKNHFVDMLMALLRSSAHETKKPLEPLERTREEALSTMAFKLKRCNHKNDVTIRTIER